MKTVITATIAIVVLMIGAQSVYAVKYVSDLPKLNHGQHYQNCDDKGGSIGLVCDIVNNTPSYDQGIKVGYNDSLNGGIYHHLKAGHPLNVDDLLWTDGYLDGWVRSCMDSGRTSEDCNLTVLGHKKSAHIVYVETTSRSGFKHGVADATADNAPDCNDPKVSHPKCKDDYIDQPDKGFFFHSKQFVNGYVKGWCSIMGPNAGTERVSAIFDCDKDPSTAGWATNSKGRNPIPGGIAIEASGIPPGGINLLYSYIDHTSGTRGTDQVNATENGQLDMVGFSSDVDNGYYPGDKVTVSVSKYVSNGDIPYATIDANGNASYIPQPIIDSKTVTLGETGAVIDLSTWNAWPHNSS